MQPTQNLILYDWLTFSCGFSRDDVISFLGLQDVAWKKGYGSRLFYSERWEFEGISIHFSDNMDKKYNYGVCVEMSGKGCRAFETFGGVCFPRLLYDLRQIGANVSRIDIAYDDFTGMIDINEMFRAASNLEFRCTKKSFQLAASAPDRDPAHCGKSVCHGSRDSEVFFRCYDKRVERKAWDEFTHWVRFEMQLRKDAAQNFVNCNWPLGRKFSAVLNNYLAYLVPDPDDSNTSRWSVVPWWSDLVGSIDSISLYTKKDMEYNKLRLDNYVFRQAGRAIAAEIACIGLDKFLDQLPQITDPEYPDKYLKVISDQRSLDKKKQEAKKIDQARRDAILKSIIGEYLSSE